MITSGSRDLTIVLAYHFPPENVIGGQRPFRFCKFLSQRGYRCHVISAADVTSVATVEGSFVPDPFVTHSARGHGWHLERLIRRVFLPGMAGSQWSLLAFRKALRVVKENSDCRITIFSSSPPTTVHIAAYLLKRRTKLPWVADCRDPVADNPAINRMNWLTRWIYRRLEASFVRFADVTIANTDSAQKRLQQRYPDVSERIELIWNGFDPEERLTPLPLALTGRKVLAHVGDLYGGRTIAPLLQSLRRLIDVGKLDKNSIQLLLVGSAVFECLPDREVVLKATHEGWLNCVPERVSQARAQQIMRSVDSLLIVQPQTVLQVPGKLFEYLQIGRPILAFIPRESPVEHILAHSGVPYTCFYTSDNPAEQDNAILNFFQTARTEVRPNAWFEQTFNAQLHTDKVIQMIERINQTQSLVPMSRAASV